MSESDAPADCILRIDRDVFDDIVGGRLSAMPALLRGLVELEGDAELLVRFQRLFPVVEPATRRGPIPLGRRRRLAMAERLVRILDGNTFVVSDDRGDIEASATDPTGLFSYDTRFLSKWVLTVDGTTQRAVDDDLQYFEARFFLVPGTGTVYIDAKLSVIRERAVGDGFHEELTILNHADRPRRAHGPHRRRCRLRRPVRGQGRPQEGRATYATRSRAVGCASPTRATRSAARRPSRHRRRRRSTRTGLTFAVHIEPHGQWTTDLDVT